VGILVIEIQSRSFGAAGVFLDMLGAIAYKEIKRTANFVVPDFGKLVKQKRKARMGFNPKTQQKIKIPAKTVVKF
jgi:DNA-binding protein HU-beta